MLFFEDRGNGDELALSFSDVVSGKVVVVRGFNMKELCNHRSHKIALWMIFSR